MSSHDKTCFNAVKLKLFQNGIDQKVFLRQQLTCTKMEVESEGSLKRSNIAQNVSFPKPLVCDIVQCWQFFLNCLISPLV